MKEKVILDDRRIGLLLFKLSLPAFLGMSVMALYNAVDTVFVGHYVGPLGIAALSVAFPVQMCFLGLGQMIGMGAASLSSRSMGAGNLDRARKALGNAIVSTLVLSAIVMALVLPRVEGLSRMMGASPAVIPFVRTYLRLILLGAFVQFSPIVLGNLIRAEGNARVPMQGMMLGAGLNIGLDALFITKMGMGIGGAALGTVISQSVSTVYLCSHYILGHSPLGLRLRAMVPRIDVLTEIYTVGSASFARTVAGSLSVVIINRTLALHGGDMAVSAFGILHRLAMFAVMPSMAIGQGLQPVLGYNYGARRPREVLRSIWLASGIAGLCSIGVFLMVFFSPQPLVKIFTDDPTLIPLASQAAKKMFLALYLVGFSAVGSLAFQSMGRPLESFITSVSRPALFMIPSVLILGHLMGANGVWLSFPLADVLTFLLTYLLLIPHLRRFRLEAMGER